MVLALAVAVSNGGPAGVPAIKAQEPVGAGFQLDAGDLRFIFRQIQIAQNHSAGNALFGPGTLQVNDARLPFGLRAVDGTNNHLLTGQTNFGAADQIFPRMTTPLFRTAQPLPFDPDGPGPLNAGDPTSYDQKKGVVIDGQPRVVTNLIADQSPRNLAAAEVAAGFAEPGAEPEIVNGAFFIPNTAPDVGLSAPFNTMLTFFGQFFDHGLDLLNKGGSGTVIMPLQPDDPLIAGPDGQLNTPDDLPANRRFMVITRGTRLPGPNGIVGDDPATPGVDESADDIHEGTNQTSPFVDQNQTYTSHPSHQVFLREYRLNAGRPVSTGRMIDGDGGNIGTWADIKRQAREMLGIALTDQDVFNVPLLSTDSYGYFRRGANGLPQFVLPGGPPSPLSPARLDDPATPLDETAPVPANALRTGHAFLDDIAHHAVPFGDHDNDPATPSRPLVPDTSGANNGPDDTSDDGNPATYDNELLDAHFVTGDGRGNENIALTAVHTVFHAEHNRLAGEIPGLLDRFLAEGSLTLDEVNAWRAPDAASGWDFGERVFQAAKFVTEMEYQHLVFEEFGRKLVPTIDEFQPDGINFQNATNPAITAEFAHAAYRLGHSMLTETISRMYFNPDGSVINQDIDLVQGFLNPLEFNRGPGGRQLTAREAAGAIFQGGTRQVANEIDEFVTEAVRNKLLGLPLDLGAINIARGRSEGLRGLNEVRRQLFTATADSSLTPYESWIDFKFAMRNQASLANFIAAYGTHVSITSETTMARKRAAAQALIDANSPFLFQSASTSGVDNIDLWIGGLAEKIAPFGGMLGPTFNKIFEQQLEKLQNGDRFYYLERLDGLNLLAQLEANSFGEMISRNTTAAGMAADVFARPGLVFNVAALLRTPGVISDDPSTPDDESANTDLVLLPNGTLRYIGAEHVIWNGSARGDHLHSSEGDDTMRGSDGNDVMEGGTGNDQHIGGAGDDIMLDSFGEDVIKGGPGNDAISGGAGPFDLLQGNEGDDFIVGGVDASEIFGGAGNDIMFTGSAATESFGGAGDDWMEAGNQLNLLVGDENNQFQNDTNGGDDVMIGGDGDDDFDAEGGNDIMVAHVLGTDRLEGMLGFDWVTYRGETQPVDADMNVSGLFEALPNINELRDRFDLTEALSGSSHNDILRGDNRGDADLRNGAFGITGNRGIDHVLTKGGVDRIPGLRALMRRVLNLDLEHATPTPGGPAVDGIPDAFSGGNIILGGPGSDIIEGRGGNDVIDGDAWLNVQLEGPDPVNGGTKRADSLSAFRTDVFAGRINPGDIRIVREIVVSGGRAEDEDTAVFSEPLEVVDEDGVVTPLYVCGPRPRPGVADQRVPCRNNPATFVRDEDGGLTIEHISLRPVPEENERLIGAEGIKKLRNIERLQFADGPDPDQAPDIVRVNSRTQATVPGVGLAARAAARAAIFDADLNVGRITFAASDSVPAGSVISQSVAPGAIVDALTQVDLVISLGRANLLVPAVLGQSEADARAAIIGAGLTVGGVTREFSESVAAGLAIRTTPAEGETVARGAAVALVISRGADVVLVPSIVGQSEAEARTAITSAGLTVGTVTTANSDTVPAGNVISQTLAAESSVARNSAMSFVVSLGPATALVPGVVGQARDAAVATITGAGFAPVVNEVNDATVAAGIVISQDPAADASRARGSAVTLVVSLGPARVAVPNLLGLTRTAAESRITETGFSVGTVTNGNSPTAPIGTVISQNPPTTESALPGSAVSFVVTLGALVPNVVGSSSNAAATLITNAGLTVGAVTQVYNASPVGSIVSQNPASGASVAPGTAVATVTSLGPAPAGLVLALSFEEASGTTALDWSGRGLNGTIREAARVPGKAGRGLSFDGVNDWVTVADTTGSPIDLTTGMTLAAWVNPAELSGWETVILKERGLSGLSYALYAHDGAPDSGTAFPAAYARINAVDVAVRGTSTLALNTWSHLAATYDGANQRIYVNGQLVATNPITGPMAVANGALRIGGNNMFAGEFFRGVIDEVRVFNRALNADEIAAQAGVDPSVPPPPPPPPPPASNGLVLALGFEETAGTTAADASGNGLAGTITGATLGAAGRFGNALSFDGVDDWVTVADVPALGLTTGMTLEAWVNPTALAGWNTVLMKEREGGLSYSLYANDDLPRPAGYARVGGAEQGVPGPASLPLNTWSHVAVTYDGTTMRLYVDGGEVATATLAGPIDVSAGALRIGGNSVWGEFFTGRIDEVRIYNRALAAAEIAADRDRPVR